MKNDPNACVRKSVFGNRKVLKFASANARPRPWTSVRFPRKFRKKKCTKTSPVAGTIGWRRGRRRAVAVAVAREQTFARRNETDRARRRRRRFDFLCSHYLDIIARVHTYGHRTRVSAERSHTRVFVRTDHARARDRTPYH